MSNRAAGILLPITSLPSKYGIGCFSKSAYDFVDWLKDAGQTYWQILPICPTSYGDSPYQSFSTFAGNPYFISLEALIEEGVLTEEECAAVNFGTDPIDIDYEAMYYGRYPLLRMAYERSNVSKDHDYQVFVAENNWWLADYALFMALKDRFGGKSWTEWPEDIRLRWGYALDYYRRELYFDIEFYTYLQFKFFQQYRALKNYANQNGIKIVGDIPIYVAMDSADTWANPELFQLDENNVPTAVAGCPPDAFAAIAQGSSQPVCTSSTAGICSQFTSATRFTTYVCSIPKYLLQKNASFTALLWLHHIIIRKDPQLFPQSAKKACALSDAGLYNKINPKSEQPHRQFHRRCKHSAYCRSRLPRYGHSQATPPLVFREPSPSPQAHHRLPPPDYTACGLRKL